jgi:hypothetical protein
MLNVTNVGGNGKKNGQKVVVICHHGFLVQIHDGKQVHLNLKSA